MKHPLLAQVHTKNPCPMSWQAMKGDDGKRFCEGCRKHVHDLSHLTANEAEALLQSEERLCVRYFKTPDGKILHRPEPDPKPTRMTRLRHLVAGLLMACFGLSTPGCGTTNDVKLRERQTWQPPEPPPSSLGEQPDGTWLIGDPGVYPESHSTACQPAGHEGPAALAKAGDRAAREVRCRSNAQDGGTSCPPGRPTDE